MIYGLMNMKLRDRSLMRKSMNLSKYLLRISAKPLGNGRFQRKK
jgi:hypothetical protein